MSRLGDHALVRRALGRAAQAAAPPAGTADLTRELGPQPLADDDQPLTTLLYERLDRDDVEEVHRRAAQEHELQALDRSAPAFNRWLVLSYGIWLGVPSVAAKTGLPFAQPPDDVHAMARGPFAAAGGLYEADLVVGALVSAGVELNSVTAALDFGCSSGRVVRVLAAGYPEVRWSGCDPNKAAIAWARENLPGIEFFVNPQHPPLGVEHGSLDLVYAISIWSHFAPELGIRWFDEMHGLIRPGGHLVCTTHGLQSLAFYTANGLRSSQQGEEILRALYRRGWWYAAEFGPQGDSGVVNPEWGTAFLSPEWMLTKLCPRWRVAEYASGRNQSNQDVYVLERI